MMSFFSRQTAGALRDGKESICHALPRLLDDLREDDRGRRHRVREKTQAHHPQLGLPEAAEGAGHAAPGEQRLHRAELICDSS